MKKQVIDVHVEDLACLRGTRLEPVLEELERRWGSSPARVGQLHLEPKSIRLELRIALEDGLEVDAPAAWRRAEACGVARPAVEYALRRALSYAAYAGARAEVDTSRLHTVAEMTPFGYDDAREAAEAAERRAGHCPPAYCTVLAFQAARAARRAIEAAMRGEVEDVAGWVRAAAEAAGNAEAEEANQLRDLEEVLR